MATDIKKSAKSISETTTQEKTDKIKEALERRKLELEVAQLEESKKKLELEIEQIEVNKKKTDLEIKDLERPPFFRAAFIIALGPALLALFAAMMAIYFGTYSSQIEELKNANKDLANKNQELVDKDKEISNKVEAVNTLGTQKDKLEDQISKLSETTDTEKKEKDRLFREKESIEKESSEIKFEKNKLDNEFEKLTAEAAFEQINYNRLKEKQQSLESENKLLEARKAKLEKDVETAPFRTTLSSMFKDDVVYKGMVGLKSYENLKEIYKNNIQFQDAYDEILQASLNLKNLNFYYKALVLSFLYEVSSDENKKKEAREKIYEFFKTSLFYKDVNYDNLLVHDTLFRLFLKKLNQEERNRLFSIVAELIKDKKISEEKIILQIYDSMTNAFYQENSLECGCSFYKNDKSAFFEIVEQAKIFALNKNNEKRRIGLQALRYFTPTGYAVILGYLIANEPSSSTLQKEFPFLIGKNSEILFEKLQIPSESSSDKWREWIKNHYKLYDLWLNKLEALKKDDSLLNSIMERGEYQ